MNLLFRKTLDDRVPLRLALRIEERVSLPVGSAYPADHPVRVRVFDRCVQRGSLGERLNRVRLLLVDLVSFAFCVFFAWKSWTLWHEAWVDKQTTSSSWGPPLSIPYGLMATGMTLLSLQLLLQCIVRIAQQRHRHE